MSTGDDPRLMLGRMPMPFAQGAECFTCALDRLASQSAATAKRLAADVDRIGALIREADERHRAKKARERARAKRRHRQAHRGRA